MQKEQPVVEDRKEAVKNLVQLLCALDDIDDSPERESQQRERSVRRRSSCRVLKLWIER